MQGWIRYKPKKGLVPTFIKSYQVVLHSGGQVLLFWNGEKWNLYDRQVLWFLNAPSVPELTKSPIKMHLYLESMFKNQPKKSACGNRVRLNGTPHTNDLDKVTCMECFKKLNTLNFGVRLKSDLTLPVGSYIPNYAPEIKYCYSKNEFSLLKGDILFEAKGSVARLNNEGLLSIDIKDYHFIAEAVRIAKARGDKEILFDI